MKCQSVECLWPATTPPPLHRITVTAVLNQPPTLYTGGSDGSIIWWKLSPSITRQQNYQDVWPMAMLCGHATPIADLDICVPLIDTGEIEDSININSTSIGSEALISVCTDGVLCIWSSHSGHCKRRRKMPPWVGSPTAMVSLSSSRRYVCVACSYAHVPNYNTGEIAEAGNTDHIQNETVIERETPSRRTSKGAVVIVDSCTLNIVRTIFHGILSIGPVKSMALLAEDKKDQSVIMADSVGRIQSIAILKESRPEGEGGSGSEKSPRSFVWADVSDDEIQGISIAPHGRLLASIFSNHCTFKSTVNGSNVGEISFADNYLFKGSQTYLSGGMFLEGETKNVTDVLERENFVVWSNTGAALVCAISGSGDTFSFDLLLEIPNVSHSPHVKVGILFCQLSCYILRMESICSDVEYSSLWKPRISIWSFCPVEQSESGKNYDHGDPYLSSMLGEGGFLGDWTWSSFCFPKYEAGLGPTNSNGCCVEHGNDLKLEGRIVSSSLILSEESYTPYAVVYGFYSGEIAVVGLEMFCDGNTNNGIGMHASDITFLGHMGAVLCLAAHRMVATSDQQSPKHLLVSGSMDCTIRIWDLNSGSLVSVMHHHLEPVRQIILPPPWTNHPWNNCFLSVGDDACVALVSLETLHVERMFPGHPNYPGLVVWDSARGYIACLCREVSDHSDAVDILYLWDAKTGARERVLRGTASHSMFDHFCKGVNINSVTGNILGGTTSAPSLLLHAIEDTTSIEGISISSAGGKAPRRSNISSDLNGSLSQNSKGKLPFSKPPHELGNQNASGNSSRKQVLPELLQNKKHLIKCSCPTPGVAILKFDLSSLVASIKQDILLIKNDGKDSEKPNVGEKSCSESSSEVQEALIHLPEQNAWASTPEGCLLRFSLPFLHLWGVDTELDTLLVDEMGICRPEKFLVAPGLEGDRGSLTLVFPGLHTTLELWKSSSEFCAMRSLTMVTLAQRMINLTCPTSAASSALAAFYTRNFAERVPDIKPPLLQLLVSFWQDPTEHVRMAARSLFHCAASRAIPLPICNQRTTPRSTNSGFVNFDTAEISPNSLSNLDGARETQENCLGEESEILDWLESYEMQDWICYIGGTSQDAKASHIIVAGALVVWYPSLVKPSLATAVVHHLVKLVMAMTDKYSATAAELLAEGMECTWKACIGPEIPHLIRDIFLLIECLNSASTNTTAHHPVTSVTIREILVGILLPSLAMADIAGFLNIIESQIWATASDSPVHLVSLMTLIRIIRGSPKPLAPYLDKVVDFILQTMDPGNSVMRKACLNSSMVALKEVVRIFSMVALNEASTKLAVGDAIGDIRNLSIKVYDIHSGTKIKVLDASGPPGLPSLLDGASDRMITTAISALSFSPDGEGLVAFSEHGLIIRWWSLGGAWWEKLSRSMIPVQCTKLIFVPPWEGFSPNKSRSSIMASIIGHSSQPNPEEKTRGSPDVDGSKLPIHNLDLSYRLEWGAGRKLVLMRHGQELGSFQL